MSGYIQVAKLRKNNIETVAEWLNTDYDEYEKGIAWHKSNYTLGTAFGSLIAKKSNGDIYIVPKKYLRKKYSLIETKKI